MISKIRGFKIERSVVYLSTKSTNCTKGDGIVQSEYPEEADRPISKPCVSVVYRR